MAALAADIAVVFDPNRPPNIQQAPVTGADSFFRGGWCYWATGQVEITPVDASLFAGVVLQGLVATAAAELLWIAHNGRFHYACAQMDLGDEEVTWSGQAADLFDNPATSDAQGATDPGCCGTLDQITVDGASGWIDHARRSAIVNA